MRLHEVDNRFGNNACRHFQHLTINGFEVSLVIKLHLSIILEMYLIFMMHAIALAFNVCNVGNVEILLNKHLRLSRKIRIFYQLMMIGTCRQRNG